ncbi:MAG: hypothetical protein A2Y40_03330 [Candidatus Margulisbacteria bacterium GWF2_35_9]|nr:MAG: hypothetical protein A2Y40_03330 [Candidatus Margulisbacteria bacterium GWF2_35_9]
MIDNQTENELIKDVQNGNLNAFEHIISDYQKPIFKAINGMVANYEVAKDLTQDTFFKAFEKIDQFQFRSKFSTWLFRIAYNAAKAHLITNTNKARLNEKYITEETLITYAENTLESIEDLRMIYKALDQVDPQFKGALILYCINNISYEEIAEIIDVPMGTVKSRIYRGKQQLIELLPECIKETHLHR